MITGQDMQGFAHEKACELELLRIKLSQWGFKLSACLVGVAAAALVDEALRATDSNRTFGEGTRSVS